ncbi:family 20 glycosylhydrolase, partial [Streptomyces sp. DH12]
MLDVSRHFFSVDEVKRYIDRIALYKINKLHLHLSDDQGWRIAVDSWPRLAAYGGSTEVGGGPGGHYTKDDYREIVRYAASRYLEVVPEIDMPGHTNAALASYAELNCDGVAPPLYTGTEVGFSSLCVGKEITYDFVEDVVREIAALTPGRYLHIGGDEAHSTPHEEYVAFMERVQPVVARYGK